MSLLSETYRQTEFFLEKAIQVWQNLPAATMAYQVHPKSWSAVQCIEHLNIYGRYYLPAIEKAIANAPSKNAPPQYKSGWLGNYFYHQMLLNANGTLPSKMNAPKNAIPPTTLDVQKVVAEFIDQQEQLLKLIEKARTVNLAKARVPISIAQWIRLQLGDVFLFLTAHNQRHIMQLERAIAASTEQIEPLAPPQYQKAF